MSLDQELTSLLRMESRHFEHLSADLSQKETAQVVVCDS